MPKKSHKIFISHTMLPTQHLTLLSGSCHTTCNIKCWLITLSS